MIYKVTVTAKAELAIADYIDYIANVRQEPINADKVWRAIWDKIPTLETMPHRCPEAPESEQVDYIVRALVIKKTIVVLYRVNETSKEVIVIGFRTGGTKQVDLKS